jgi:hypothetical protein
MTVVRIGIGSNVAQAIPEPVRWKFRGLGVASPKATPGFRAAQLPDKQDGEILADCWAIARRRSPHWRQPDCWRRNRRDAGEGL